MADGTLIDPTDLTDTRKNSLHSTIEDVVREAQYLSDKKKEILIEAIRTGMTTDLWKVF